MAAPTVTGLDAVNAYNPAVTFHVFADGTHVYATPADYWLRVTGTNLDTVTSVEFTKTGNPNRAAPFHVLSPTLLEVKIPYTVLDHSYVKVTNPDGDATSARNVTPVFAGPWRTHGTVSFDLNDFPGEYPAVYRKVYDSSGAKTIGPQTDGTGAPLMSYAAVVDNVPASFNMSTAGIAQNVIVNDLIDPSLTVIFRVDDVEWTVGQSGILVDLSGVFYTDMADLGVPGYIDGSLLPPGAVEAIPDGTDLPAPFFDARITALTLTLTGRNGYADRYVLATSYAGPSGTWDVYNPSLKTWEMRSDVIEFRQTAPGVGSHVPPNFQSMSALTAAPLLGSATVSPDAVLRTPASQELEPGGGPIFVDPPADFTVDVSAASALINSKVHYTTVLESSRTYNDPTDPGQPPMITFALEGGGTDTVQDQTLICGASVGFDEHMRVRATWHPPRYRYFYTTPQPFEVPLRQLQRGDSLAGGAPRQLQTPAASVRQGPGRIR